MHNGKTVFKCKQLLNNALSPQFGFNSTAKFNNNIKVVVKLIVEAKMGRFQASDRLNLSANSKWEWISQGRIQLLSKVGVHIRARWGFTSNIP